MHPLRNHARAMAPPSWPLPPITPTVLESCMTMWSPWFRVPVSEVQWYHETQEAKWLKGLTPCLATKRLPALGMELRP